MFALISSVLAVSDSDGTGVDTGPVEFIAIAFIAVCVILLIIDMTRRIRRSKMRDEIAAKLDAEQAEQAD